MGFFKPQILDIPYPRFWAVYSVRRTSLACELDTRDRVYVMLYCHIRWHLLSSPRWYFKTSSLSFEVSNIQALHTRLPIHVLEYTSIAPAALIGIPLIHVLTQRSDIGTDLILCSMTCLIHLRRNMLNGACHDCSKPSMWQDVNYTPLSLSCRLEDPVHWKVDESD